MKTIKNLCIALVSVIFLFACEIPQHEVFKEVKGKIDMSKRKKTFRHVIPFQAEFMTTRTSLIFDSEECEAPYGLFFTQEGQGQGAPIGKFTTKFTFCLDPVAREFVDGKGTFFMENGDELYYTLSGQVVNSEDPDFDSEFSTPFAITGGSGRFEGASGRGYGQNFVKTLENGNEIHHKWRGIIVLPQKS